MALEIERKFLLRQPISAWSVDVLASAAAEVTQGYLTSPDAEVEVRLRRARELSVDLHGNVAEGRDGPWDDEIVQQWLAIKTNVAMRREEGGFSRHELEVVISAEEFDTAWRLVGDRVLRKVRTSVSIRDPVRGPYEVSVDTFMQRLDGLVLAEVEFQSWRESVAFQPPPFFGREVTHDRRFRNGRLAGLAEPPPL